MCLQSRNTYNVKSLKQRKSFELYCQVINIRGVVRAMEIISPHGFSISLNLPKPECSTELNITTASFFYQI
jgi:hypothetical protein